MVYCPNAGHQARPSTNLGIDIVKVKLDGFLAYASFTGNCFIGFTFKNQLKDLPFALGEIR
jgi:hypothetical protein